LPSFFVSNMFLSSALWGYGVCCFEFAICPEIEEEMDKGGNEPGDGVGHIEHEQGTIEREYAQNPYNTQNTAPHQRSNHRCERGTHTAQTTYNGIHNAT